MHELSIASSILETLKAEAERRPGARICKVGLRVGELSGVDKDALAFGFEALVRDTPWQPLALEIEFCPLRQRCRACGYTFVVVDYQWTCPECSASDTECISGDELDIAYLEVEEP